MDVKQFLQTVVTTEDGWFCLAFCSENNDGLDTKEFHEEFFSWPDDIDKIISRANKLKDENNVYFSPYLFSEKKARQLFVKESRTIVADLDDANLLTLPFKATVLVETSPNRHQGYWLLKYDCDPPEKHREYAQRLTYSIEHCDRGGWYPGKLLRFPGTFNHKYRSGPKPVRIISNTDNTYEASTFDMLPTVLGITANKEETELELDWVQDSFDLQKVIGYHELLQSVRDKIPGAVYINYGREQSDRSETLWALMHSLFRAGLDKTKVYYLAYNSANNKFSDLRYNGDIELAKDVLRAETNYVTVGINIKAAIASARSLSGKNDEKRLFIASLVRKHMDENGQFIHGLDNSIWYIPDASGRPTSISSRSEHLLTLFDIVYGLNSTEQETKYTIANIQAYVLDMPQTGTVAYLTYYNAQDNIVYIHTGRRDVLCVKPDKTEVVINGYNNIIFPWAPGAETLNPRFNSTGEEWYKVLFDDCLDNLTGIEKDQALILLRAWFLMLIMRHGVVSKPILALFGQPGSGKSTMFRRIYALLYGKKKSLNAVSTADNFDFATSVDPLVVLDNVDSYDKWLPDRLALAAANSEMVKRKLYTDGDTVILQRTAFIGITAHNPKFGREDVVDRLILLNFERLRKFKPETDIIAKITKVRDSLWGSIIRDIQSVLSTPQPDINEVPQFRIEDFSYFGTWISKSLGEFEEFKDAITSLKTEQRSFSLDEDALLIDGIKKVVASDFKKNDFQWRTAGKWWSILETGSDLAFKRRYVNAVSLGKKFWTLQESLKELYEVEWRYDKVTRSRMWRFLPLENTFIEEPVTNGKAH